MLAQHEYLVQLRRLVKDSNFALVVEQLAIVAHYEGNKKIEQILGDTVKHLKG